MKILDNISYKLSEYQKKLLESLLYKRLNHGDIRWKDVFYDIYKRRLSRMESGVQLDKIPPHQIINENLIQEQLDDLVITLGSLLTQCEDIDFMMHNHQMFHKDKSNIFFNMSRGIDKMISNEVKNYELNNILFNNGVIELLPTQCVEYAYQDVHVSYFPEHYLAKFGNDPTPSNLSHLNSSEYWVAEVITQQKSVVGAHVILVFSELIRFNTLLLDMLGKYNVTIHDVSWWNGSAWISLRFLGNTVDRYTQISVVDDLGRPVAITTNKIRVTLIQEKPDYIWKREVTNERDIMSQPDVIYEQIMHNMMYHNDFDIMQRRVLKNVFSYVFGLYHIRTMFLSYSGLYRGEYVSQPIMLDKGQNRFTIQATVIQPSDTSIRFEIIQHDGSVANIYPYDDKIILGKTYQLVDTYSFEEMAFGSNNNMITLRHTPIPSTMVVKVNDQEAQNVPMFENFDRLEYIIYKNEVHFNKVLTPNDIVKIQYKHYTDFIRVRIILSNDSQVSAFVSPKVYNFEVNFHA